jgi:hypothetical protein
MIVSHEYKFIFIKTHKVGSTSIEYALDRFAGPDGIVTPFSVRIDEKERQDAGVGGARNHEKDGKRLRAHTPAQEARALLGADIFDAYFKFSVERNSYDKAVSMYCWKDRDPARRLGKSFDEFLAGGGAREAVDFDRYSIGGRPAMDFMILYHDLQDGLDAVAERLKLPGRIDVSAIRRKSGYRASPGYRAYYSPASRERVAAEFAREIAHFGFAF